MLDAEPHCDPGTMIMARAYAELATCRMIGMSVGPIPWSAMLEWCQFHDLDRDVTKHLISVIMLVDAEYARRRAVASSAPAPKAAP